MKIPVIKKVKSEVDIDIKSIAKNLIKSNIDNIIDILLDEYSSDPTHYLDKGIIEIDNNIVSTIIEYLSEELFEILSRKC